MRYAGIFDWPSFRMSKSEELISQEAKVVPDCRSFPGTILWATFAVCRNDFPKRTHFLLAGVGWRELTETRTTG